MPYTAEVSRANPSCFLFLIDQSGSMKDPFGGGDGGKHKSNAVADAINRLLSELVLKCTKADGVRDYFHVGVMAYGDRVRPAFGGSLAGRELVSISEIANSPMRLEERRKSVEDGAGGILERPVKFPVWFDPVAIGGTPMCEALTAAFNIIQRWVSEHVECYPPTVINITDGEATDGNPSTQSEALRSLASSDGQVLLFNLHLSSKNSTPVEFPDSDEYLPDDHARLLYRMSSVLPDYLRQNASNEGIRVSETTRGFAFNADMVAVIRFLDIGTRASNLR